MLNRLLARAEGLFWQVSRPVRHALREARRRAVLSRHRQRARGRGSFRFETLAAVDAESAASATVALPGIQVGVVWAGGSNPESWRKWLGAQSESAWDSGTLGAVEARWLLLLQGVPRPALPRSLLELLRLIGELEDLDWIADEIGGATLVRAPQSRGARSPALGRLVAIPPASSTTAASLLPLSASGEHRLAAPPPSAGAVRRGRRSVATLFPHPETGRRGALLLAPFLAMGGAEQLLLDYAREVSPRRRLVVATTEAHRSLLGERLGEAHEIVPVFPLGDLVDRSTHLDAVSQLIVRHRLETIAAWNGCGFFYEALPRIRSRFPELRVVNQLFDHRVGWIRRLTPDLIAATDLHLAVNADIARALEHTHGVPAERIAVVRHGVRAPRAVDPVRRARLRGELGAEAKELVVVSLIRLHSQKRPHDLLDLAHRCADLPARFVVVGGGPLEAAMRRDLTRRDCGNVVLLPFDPDARRWLEAADLCLLTSAYEGLPLFLLEGMAHGVPFVATAVGEIPALAQAGAGRAFAVGDLDGMEHALREFAAPENRASHRNRALALHSERFGLDRFIAEMDAALFGSEPS